ncbi:MAG: L,D-transpeptidase family protein [Solirubrobacteraceae bacterium]
MSPRRYRRRRYVLAGVILVIIAILAAGAIVFASAKASLTAAAGAIAKIGMPLGGGTIQSVSVVTGPHSAQVPVVMRGDRVILPKTSVPANEQLSVRVVVKRPGWISWLAGNSQTLTMTMTTPVASLRSHYLTVAHNVPLRLHFKQPIRAISYGGPGHLQRHVLATPQTVVTLPRSAEAGTTFVSAQIQPWETSATAAVSWFPAGRAASAVATPAPDTKITPRTPITLTFSKPVSEVLGSHLPPVSPDTQGSWHRLSDHAIQFRPEGYGYGLAAKVSIPLPNGVHLVGGSVGLAGGGTWTVPAGSTVRVQQVLALLGYLPLRFSYAGSGVGLTPTAQEDAAVKPPAGTFRWRYPNTPAALKSFWKVGASGTMLQGALMAFENDHGVTADGVAGPVVWKGLIAALVAGKRNTSGYTFVSVREGSQSLTLWHSGTTVIASTPVNTGAPGTATATGTYPVFEHLPVTTMSGTNPDGSHYADAGIPDVSYFNGGDALHGFTRAQYGSPQSLGCVEMPYGVAAKLYPYTPIGTLVHVS